MSAHRPPPDSQLPEIGASPEWIGGIATMPSLVTGEGEPFHPAALLWVGNEGVVLGVAMEHPDEVLELAAEHLGQTMDEPMIGPAHTPERIRVASDDLAAEIRAGHPSIDVLVGPTPELDEVIDSLAEHMSEGGGDGPYYTTTDAEPDAVRAFCDAAAGVFRARPWDVVPGDGDLVSVTIGSMGLRDAVLSVIGQMGDSLGFVLFPSVEDFHTFTTVGDVIARGGEPDVPPHLSLSFDPAEDAAPGILREFAEHDWPVATDEAYPLLMVMQDNVPSPPSAGELAMAEAIARALPDFVADEETLWAAWEAGEPISRTFAVQTRAGETDVTLQVPHPADSRCALPPEGLLRDIVDAARRHGPDGEALEPAHQALLDRLKAAPETEGISDLWGADLYLRYGIDYLGETVAALGPADLDEIVFGIIPDKVVAEPSDARGIIEGIRALYGFLGREFGLAQAEACRRLLGPDAVEELEAELSDSSNFGMGKSLVMAGKAAGYAVDTEEGLQAWMQSVQGKPLPESILPDGWPRPAGPGSPESKVTIEEKKARREAQRKAQKRKRKRKT